MPLHSYYADRLYLIENIRIEDLNGDPSNLPTEVAQRLAAFDADPEGWVVPTDVTVSNLSIPSSDGEVPVRMYRPAERTTRYMLWVRGGGFTSGNLDSPASHIVSAELGSRTGTTIVTVEYRLATDEIKYPLPLDDVVTAWNWVRELAKAEVADPVQIIGGSSAGAALVLSTVMREPEAADLLLLAYPFLHFPVAALWGKVALEMRSFPELMRFSPDAEEGMVKGYLGRIHNLPNEVMPGHSLISKNHPPTCVLLSEYDDLRPSGELFARQIAEAGTDTFVRLELGVPHGHLNHVPSAPGVEESLQWFAAAMRNAKGRPRAVR